ncbi:MAG: PfkB family carbohydrate kinase [Anaerolineales bacterium]
MSPSARNPLDYLIIGHVSADLVGDEVRLGGTAAYAGLTGVALGLSVGIVTAAGTDLDTGPLQGLPMQRLPSAQSTSFQNTYAGQDRHQHLGGRAVDLDLEAVPLEWRSARMVHLAPIADEVDPALATSFPQSMIVATPQGWMRRWNAEGVVDVKRWQDLDETLPRAEVGIVSEDDLGGQADLLSVLLDRYHVLVVTSGIEGVAVYLGGRRQSIPAVADVSSVDPTGAGDIFAACFFGKYLETRDALVSARFANHLAASSIERVGLLGVPTQQEIAEAEQEVKE